MRITMTMNRIVIIVMKKKDLCAKAGISTASVTKLGKGGHVTTEVLAKICSALDCTLDDIMEIIPER